MDQAATGRFRAPMAAWRICWPRTAISDDQAMRRRGGRASRALGGAWIKAAQLALADVPQAAAVTTMLADAGHASWRARARFPARPGSRRRFRQVRDLPRTLASRSARRSEPGLSSAILWHSAVLLRVDTLPHHRRHHTVGWRLPC